MAHYKRFDVPYPTDFVERVKAAFPITRVGFSSEAFLHTSLDTGSSDVGLDLGARVQNNLPSVTWVGDRIHQGESGLERLQAAQEKFHIASSLYSEWLLIVLGAQQKK